MTLPSYFICDIPLGITDEKSHGLCVTSSMSPHFLSCSKKHKNYVGEANMLIQNDIPLYFTLIDICTRLLKCYDASFLVDKSLDFSSLLLNALCSITFNI